MHYQVLEPGLVLVRYRATDDMLPERQGGLIACLEKECAGTPTGLVFDVAGISSVPISVPQLWLEVTSRLAPKLSCMAIASPTVLVRVAADGFGVSNILRRVPMAVKSFKVLDQALVWARANRVAAVA